jgi:hypothetical protein
MVYSAEKNSSNYQIKMKTKLVHAAKAYASSQPDKFHVFLETHGPAEWLDLVSDCDTPADVMQLMDDLVSVWDERGSL